MAIEAKTPTLIELLHGLAGPDILRASANLPVTGVFDDSRRVIPGSVFVAVRGTVVDGRKFVPDALRRGAVVVVGEQVAAESGAVVINVPDARAALATLAQRWYRVVGDQLGKLKLLGVTGTNGKSTTAFMTRAILRQAGLRCGMLGTVQYDLCNRSVTAGMTTPGPLELAAYLRECVDAGADAAVMEVSSHALHQKRTDGLRFAAAAFTNLSGDHLDYHGTAEEYAAAKARLFEGLDEHAVALVNRDDPSHVRMIGRTRARVLTYGIDNPADIRGRIVRSTACGTAYRIDLAGRELTLENPVVGRHNVYNALAAAGLAHALGVGADALVAGLNSVRDIPGRLQRVPCESAADVFVDYAHTDDALRNVLSVLQPLASRRLIVVFGCGGDRDRSKRPRMAQAAAELADMVVVTSDNPRTEAPDAIIADILPGFPPEQRDVVIVEPDRATAIRRALAAAQSGDIVCIAGKGHESHQIIGEKHIHFDDIEVAVRAAAELRAVS